MNKQDKAYIYAVLSIIFWSTVASAFKLALKNIDSVHLLLYSSLVASVSIFVILAFRRQLPLLFTQTRHDCNRSAFLGFINPYLYYLILFFSYTRLPAQEALALNWIWPLVVVFFSVPVLKQKINSWSIFALLISFFGVAITAIHGSFVNIKFSDPAGVVFALGSALIWALFWVLNVKDKRSEEIKLFMNFLFGSIYLVITIVLTSAFSIVDKIVVAGNQPSLFEVYLPVLWVGLFEMGLTFVLWLKALSNSRTTAQISNLVFITPFLSLFVISFILHEKILISTIIGLIFVIFGIVLQQIKGMAGKNN